MESVKGIVRTVVLQTNQPTIICGPTESRLALLFSPPGSGAQFYTVSTDPAVTSGGGLNLNATTGPLEITAQAYGDAPVRSWYGIASPGSPLTIGFLETVMA
jgi:hypothetical protein